MNHNNHFRSDSSRLTKAVRLGLVAVGAWFFAAEVLSNPVNPTVVNGTASFNQAGNVLTVTNSNGAIINWDKFSIQRGETTHFAQTSASSSVMNRVLNDPTVIYGTLSSNGRVFLVNPAGIMVGPGGRVDTAGFVASTLNIRNEDFLAGRNLFVNDGNAKDVINQGEIKTPAGGSVYLIGTNVGNESIITTPQGETILAAGATVSLIDSATPGVKVDITGAEGNVTNLGTITAEAGRIGIAGVIIRNSGILNASSLVSDGGRIFLKASQDAYVDGNGHIVATGTGGSVEILVGNGLSVADNASIDVSGTIGGKLLLDSGNIALHNVGMPVNAVVVSGSVSLNPASGVLAVTSSNGAIINWDKFSIQPGEATLFLQASTSSAVLNRVLGDPLAIYGKLKSSTGRVWLVNPAGIMVGPGGRIDVATYVRETLNVNNIEFHAARVQFIHDGTFKGIVTQSQMTTSVGGGVYLTDNQRNTTAPGSPPAPGAIVSLIDSATPGVKVDIRGANGGNIDVGSITAAAVRIGIAGVLVRNGGTPGAR